MLTFFSVENFMNFRNRIEWDLKKVESYDFNTDVICNGVISKGLVYGYNGSGKSNLVLAVFDIIAHLSDNRRHPESYELYTNLNSKKDCAVFEYAFEFDGHTVLYRYTKKALDKLVDECLKIDGKTVVSYDFRKRNGEVRLEGAELLQLSSLNPELSRVKAIKNNALLADNETNRVFMSFIKFVENMLMFYALDNRGYQGKTLSSRNLYAGIAQSGRLEEFQQLLHDNHIDYELVSREVDDKTEIHCKFGDREVDLVSVASTGTRALALFFYWFVQMKERSFVFIDEFDAFYHYELSESLVKLLKKEKKCQIFLTTHNTDLLSNDLLRPDCYFEINPDSIRPFMDKTDKELRKAHNLQRMYKAGAFNE